MIDRKQKPPWAVFVLANKLLTAALYHPQLSSPVLATFVLCQQNKCSHQLCQLWIVALALAKTGWSIWVELVEGGITLAEADATRLCERSVAIHSNCNYLTKERYLCVFDRVSVRRCVGQSEDMPPRGHFMVDCLQLVA